VRPAIHLRRTQQKRYTTRMLWNHRAYGSALDPIHKSHLVSITGDYGCPKRFWYDRNDPAVDDANVMASSGRAVLGNATHEAIACGLVNRDDAADYIRSYVDRAGSLRWRADDPPLTRLIDDRAQQVYCASHALAKRASRVLAFEQGFIVKLGEYWLSGHVDCIYEPIARPGQIAMCDWKTSAQKPHQIELDHGWEGGIYAAALTHGHFEHPYEGESRDALERRLIAHATAVEAGTVAHVPTYGQYPIYAHHVHLGDYLPYLRAGKKLVSRVEDLAWFGYAEPTEHSYVKGEYRGGAWCPVGVTEYDVPRLHSRVRAVVSMVRLGRFFDRPGEKCTRCAHARVCLTDGYQSLESDSQRKDASVLARLGGSDYDDGIDSIGRRAR